MLQREANDMANISASLFIESTDTTVREMSIQIGLEPNSGWDKRALRGVTGRLHTSNAWKLTEKASVADNADQILSAIESVLSSIMKTVASCKDNLRSVAAVNTSGLLITISSKLVPPIVLKKEILKVIAELGVDLEIDIMVF